jgi:hypothetical protein
MSTSKKSTQYGYPFNTTVEFNCLKGFKQSGSKMFLCEPSGQWKGDKPACVREAGTTLPTTLTSSLAPIADEEENSNCRLDLSLSELELTNNEGSSGGFVFKNYTSNGASYLRNGLSISYYCRSNEMLHYVAKCVNGSLIMEHNCNQPISKRITNILTNK